MNFFWISKKTPVVGEWKDTTGPTSKSLRWIELSFVSPEGKILSGVTNYNDAKWMAHARGHVYGEFITKETAMAEAEKRA